MMSIYSRQCRYRTKSRPFFCLIFFCPTGQTGFWLGLGHYSQVRVPTGHRDRASLYHKLDEAKFTLVIIIFFLLSSPVLFNTQHSPLQVIYRAKGVVFLPAVKVRDSVSGEAGPVFTEQKEFTTHPLSLCVSLSAVCGPRGSLQLERLVGLESMRGWSVWRRLLWSEVHHWHDPSASLRPGSPLQPWQRPLPAATHTVLSVEECIRPEDAECNTIVLRFFFIHGWGSPPPPPKTISLCCFLCSALLGSTRYLWCHLAGPPRHLI